ncbi:NAD(P)H-hydrate dehydratase [Methylonatrum kenyense]|uniref:NAD(P)H-hydrate dehydratase n=1 Tax=Methylonatrum kenyense TaxID=455253 RepID=UPI0020BD6DD7|nr:NAD(P)H-hydrate dehydratase [Methylonatrum kenyense]MCK8516116.1 NAD(P)H-hydrate dehydratase [Methylonatrum kenyense]
MTALPDALFRPDQVADMDRRAIQDHGVSGLELMRNAGRCAYRELRRQWPDARRLRVYCGTGNNGGDGYVIARAALADGLAVTLHQLGDLSRLQGDAATVAEEYLAAGGQRSEPEPNPPADDGVIVDALFGTGLDRPLGGAWLQAVEAINASGQPVLSVDIPSGLHGGSGQVLGAAVRADMTVTFIALKAGLFTGDGPACRGWLRFHDLALPESLRTADNPVARRYRHGDGAPTVPERSTGAHKGDSGRLLIIGGNHGMGGAALLAGKGALRAGAGLVSVLTRGAHVPALLAAQPELMAHALETGGVPESLLQRTDVVLAGPGLGQDTWARELLASLAGHDVSLVLDADALNLLAAEPGLLRPTVMTPHPGEAARLLGCTTAEIQRDRLAAAARLTERWQSVVVLKGAGTIVQSPGELPCICDGGSPALATGGTGDVLGGVVGALLAAGMAPGAAARAAVAAHAEAGEQLAARDGVRGMVASDLPAAIRGLLQT